MRTDGWAYASIQAILLEEAPVSKLVEQRTFGCSGAMRRTPGANRCSWPSDLSDGRLHAMTTTVPENGSDVKVGFADWGEVCNRYYDRATRVEFPKEG
jgi:hypothetical protein